MLLKFDVSLYNSMTFEVNQFFVRIINLCERMIVSKQTLCHSCHPFALFLVHVIITNFLGHNLTIVIVLNLSFTSLYCLNIDVMHLKMYETHKQDKGSLSICSKILHFTNMCFICIVYAWHSCLNNMNLQKK
jgi:hypothetical protein